MRKISILFIVVSILFINSLFYIAYGKTLNEVKAEKKSQQELLDKFDEQYKSLSDNINSKNDELSEKSIEITEAEKVLADLEVKLKASEESYNNTQKAFGKRINSLIQIKEGYTYVELLLSAKNVFDFYEKLNITSQIMQKDKLVMLNLKTAKRDVENDKTLKESLLSIRNQEKLLLENNLNNLNKDSETLSKEIAENKSKLALIAQDESRMIAESKVIESSLKGTTSSGSYVSGSMRWPVPVYTYVSSKFGMRNGSMHNGIDICASYGASIVAANSGTVIFSGYSGSYGNMMQVDHGGGMVTLYSHCSALNVSKGASVSIGQKIGAIGATGRATGNHLHFEVRKNGSPVNPLSGWVSPP